MRVTRLKATATVVAAAACLAVCSVSAAAAGSSAASGQHSSATLRVNSDPSQPGTPGRAGRAARLAAAQNQQSRPTTVTLVTGDQVRVDPGTDGQPSITPELAAGAKPGPASFVRFSSGADQYVVPDAAVPYLRSTLDPRLFDVSYLASARLTAIPVRITYASAQAAPALPGVQVTHRSGTTASARITPARAVQLGQMLTARWRSTRAGHGAAATGLLPGIAHIALVRAPGAPPLPAIPVQRLSGPAAGGSGLPFYTLKVKLTDLNGKTGVGIGFVQNVADAGLALDVFSNGGGTPAGAVRGPIAVAVPRGTYSLVFSILTPHASGSGFDTALVVKPQVTVNADKTVTLDARTAVPFSSSVPSVKAAIRVDSFGFGRFSNDGGGIDSTVGLVSLFMGLVTVSPGTLFAGEFPSRLLATPTAAARQGVFGFDAVTQLWPSLRAFTGSVTKRPTYLLDFPTANRIPASLHYTVPAGRLTAVHSQVYSTPSDSCPDTPQELLANLYHPWGQTQSIQFTVADGLHTNFWYTSTPRLSTFQAGLLSSDCTLRVGLRQQIRPGQQISQVWNKSPLVPSPASPTAEDGGLSTITDPALTACTACRQDNNGVLFLSPFGDSDPSHYWSIGRNEPQSGAVPTSALRFFRNGTLDFDSAVYNLSASGGVSPLGFDLPLLSGGATYRLDWTQSNAIDQNASNETDWTFHSGPANAPARLPSTVQCAPDPARACSFLPLLFINYNLALNLSNQATASTSEAISFTVRSQEHAPAPRGVTATVTASFDDGRTWTSPVPATSLGHDTFTARIQQPALADTSGFVSLRVHARDAAGNAVDQTIIRAYGLTS